MPVERIRILLTAVYLWSLWSLVERLAAMPGQLGVEEEDNSPVPGGKRPNQTTESPASSKRPMGPSMHRKASTPITVVIVGKDPIVGRAIGSLLRTAGYDTRFVADPVRDGSTSELVDAHVVILAPSLSAESHEKVLGSDTSNPVAAGTPTLELVSEADEGQPRQGHHRVPWPCSLEQLRREIEAVLKR